MCYSEVLDKMTELDDKMEEILLAMKNDTFEDYINTYLRMQRDYNNKAYEKGHF